MANEKKEEKKKSVNVLKNFNYDRALALAKKELKENAELYKKLADV